MSKDETLLTGGALKVKDVFDELKPLLDNSVVKALSNPVKQTIALKDDGSVEYVVRYLGITTATPEGGVIKLSKILSDVSKKFTILGSLAPAVQLKHIDGGTMTISYIALSADDAVKIENHDWIVREDGVPRYYMETLEDLGLGDTEG